MVNKKLLILFCLILMAVMAYGTTAQETTQEPGPLWSSAEQQLIPEVISVRPHDLNAYTQGLLLHEGVFYESTGKRGASDVRRVDPETGQVLQFYSLAQSIIAPGLALVDDTQVYEAVNSQTGQELQLVSLKNAPFAEGLALVDNRLIQLTWTEQVAMIYDVETFDVLGMYFYEGQGWGLCYDGEALWMSSGNAQLQRRDPVTFALIGTVDVTLGGEPLANINELECVGDLVYANVYQTDYIVQIEKSSGVVTGVIDASSLLTQEERNALPGSAGDHVLNGIAYDAENDVFYITGKWWNKLFEVRFVPAR
jgi:glutaminyl-peptide cyclotransferase